MKPINWNIVDGDDTVDKKYFLYYILNMSGALPNKLIPNNKIIGEDLELQYVKLQPVSASSATPFRAGGVVSFNIPAYSQSMMDTSKSYLNFDLKTYGTVDSYVENNLPIFNRLVVTSGGILIDDVQDYDTLDRIFNLMQSTEEKKAGGQTFGDYTFKNTSLTSGILSGKQKAGKHYSKKLHSSVLSCNLDYFLPLFKLGNDLKVELYLANDKDVCILNTGVYTDEYYEITNVSYNIALVKLSDKVYNQMLGLDEIKLPVQSFRRHVNDINGTVANLAVVESTKNLERLWSVLLVRKTGMTTNPVKFLGGKSTTEYLKKLQWKYGVRLFPSQPLETTTDDNNVLLSYTLANSGQFENPKSYIASLMPDTSARTVYESNMVLVNSFKSSDQQNLYDGVNLTGNNQPIMIEMEFDASLTATMVSFAEYSQVITIDSNGAIRLSQKPSS